MGPRRSPRTPERPKVTLIEQKEDGPCDPTCQLVAPGRQTRRNGPAAAAILAELAVGDSFCAVLPIVLRAPWHPAELAGHPHLLAVHEGRGRQTGRDGHHLLRRQRVRHVQERSRFHDRCPSRAGRAEPAHRAPKRRRAADRHHPGPVLRLPGAHLGHIAVALPHNRLHLAPAVQTGLQPAPGRVRGGQVAGQGL